MTKSNIATTKLSLWDRVKLILTITPAFSLILACEYYFIFFRNFDGLSLNILTLADYFNKSVEFIPIIATLILTLMGALWSYPPRFSGESEEDHYKRIGGTTKIWARVDKVDSIILKFGVPFNLLLMLVLMPTYLFLQLLPFFLIFYLVPFLNILMKHIPSDLRRNFYSRTNFYIGFMICMSIIYTYSSALSDASSIRRNIDTGNTLVDVIEAGYLERQGIELVLSDKSWKEITKVRIEPLDDRSFACNWGLSIACRSEDSVPKD